MTIKEISAIFAFVASIISGWIFLDSRHDPAGAAVAAEIYALEIAIADLTSTISRYYVLEEVGRLTEENAARRAELERIRAEYVEERARKLSGE